MMLRIRRRATLWLALVGLLCLANGWVTAQGTPSRPDDPKKGVGLSTRTPQWSQRVAALRVSWVYTWGAEEPTDLPVGVHFVPMEWGYYGNKDNALVDHLAEVKTEPGVTALLGFNEPDGKDQANLTVDAALEGWHYLQQTGLTLGSPACVHANDAWMQSFMQQADQKGYRVDFITIHWYGGADPQGFLNYLQKVHDLYHLPLWVTEFCPADWGASKDNPSPITAQQVADFMRVVVPAMDRLGYVQRYAWFTPDEGGAVMGTSALFHADGTLTDLGKLYASL